MIPAPAYISPRRTLRRVARLSRDKNLPSSDLFIAEIIAEKEKIRYNLEVGLNETRRVIFTGAAELLIPGYVHVLFIASDVARGKRKLDEQTVIDAFAAISPAPGAVRSEMMRGRRVQKT